MIKQSWQGLDGAIAWHLIERQAENWTQVGEMMNEWFIENIPTKEWVGLTDEEKEQFVVAYYPSNWDRKTAVTLMSDYEKYLKEKNNPYRRTE